MNRIDPMGRAEMVDTSLLYAVMVTGAVAITAQQELKTHAIGNALVALGMGINDLWDTISLDLVGVMFAIKADIKQNRDAANQASRGDHCRAPTPDDFETAHYMMEAEKGPNGLVPYNKLLEIWREILCGGGK